MKLYRISQEQNCGYDTFDSAVVCAPDELSARNTNPYDGTQFAAEMWHRAGSYREWAASIDQVKAQYLGEAAEGVAQGVVCASYNAG